MRESNIIENWPLPNAHFKKSAKLTSTSSLIYSLSDTQMRINDSDVYIACVERGRIISIKQINGD